MNFNTGRGSLYVISNLDIASFRYNKLFKEYKQNNVIFFYRIIRHISRDIIKIQLRSDGAKREKAIEYIDKKRKQKRFIFLAREMFEKIDQSL